MGHFRATIEGNRGEASRLGTKNSGLDVTANGWQSGIRVYAYHENGEDFFTVTLTSGSGYNSGASKHLGTFSVKDLNTTPVFHGRRMND